MTDSAPATAAARFSPTVALRRILDVHYQARSERYPEGECAVCSRLDPDGRAEIVGVRYPCLTRQLAEEALRDDRPGR